MTKKQIVAKLKREAAKARINAELSRELNLKIDQEHWEQAAKEFEMVWRHIHYNWK